MKAGRSNKAMTSKGAGPASKQISMAGPNKMAGKVRPAANGPAMTKRAGKK